ncbi:beta galactosidase jelly roll domain-containing protein [Imperialibacter roseus]|uniref:Beta galactosidase jelly roll domain-containing protein n=1 Tax=Imperialibacter roseus TaxID=1324217 RepID=A0ABZ0IXH5_9BACT|nr:beta galactosidase jelly roll domain-containing protein [Imperialibacter roseus]WOK08650.1 beta galactosidase jelly roll domain-containing protein [Imperialibacter roseus]
MHSARYISTICLLLFSASVFSQGRNMQKVVSLRGSWKFHIGDNMDWAKPKYDDSQWETIYAPSEWESEGFNGYDGYAWYRKKFDGSEVAKFNNIYLNLGYIDDVDQVFVNGHLIGFFGSFPPQFSTAYNAKRWYYIPSEFLNLNGENVISVRIFDTIHSGGIVSGDIGLFASWSSLDQGMRLEGVWKFAEGYESQWKLASFDDKKWGVIMVPGFLHTKGKKHWESTFYYRKHFKMDARLKDKPLVLLLGKIDDFDKVYLNGKLIGATNDGRPLGQSHSWETYRDYPIPPELINWEGENVISVEVTDIGGNAGIYEGPVGIFPAEIIDKFLR